MRSKSVALRLACIAAVIALTPLFFESQQTVVRSQGDVSSQNRWDQVTPVTRRARPRRVVRGRPRAPRPRRVERLPLLTVQLRLLMQGTNGQPTEVNRLNTFFPGQRLRLGVMSNQNGYLAIFRQAAPGADAQRIFPDARANEGSNYVTRNVESIVPSNCAANIDCWYPVMGPAGNEIFTIIFSRDEDVMEDIIEQATRNGGRITQQILTAAIQQSGQRIEEILRRPLGLARNNPAGVHAVWFLNNNRTNSEDIILTVPLAKGSQAASSAPTTPETSAPEPNDTTTEATPSSATGSITTTTPSTTTTTTTTGTSTRTRTTNTITPRRP